MNWNCYWKLPFFHMNEGKQMKVNEIPGAIVTWMLLVSKISTFAQENMQ